MRRNLAYSTDVITLKPSQSETVGETEKKIGIGLKLVFLQQFGSDSRSKESSTDGDRRPEDEHSSREDPTGIGGRCVFKIEAKTDERKAEQTKPKSGPAPAIEGVEEIDPAKFHFEVLLVVVQPREIIGFGKAPTSCGRGLGQSAGRIEVVDHMGKLAVAKGDLGHSADRPEMLADQIDRLSKCDPGTTPFAKLKIAFADASQQQAVIACSPFGKPKHRGSLSLKTYVTFGTGK